MDQISPNSRSFQSESQNSVSQIEVRLEDFFEAIRQGDLNSITSFYADSVIAYDLPTDLRVKGREAYRRSWEKWFTGAFEFPVTYEHRKQHVFVSEGLGIVHGIIQMSGRLRDSGEEISNWLRQTLVFRRSGKQWMIVHEHNSVPIGDDGRALMHQEPEGEPATGLLGDMRKGPLL